MRAFDALIRTWMSNFEVDDAPQPDRASALMTAANGYGYVVNVYVTDRGGLGGACIDTLLRNSLVSPDVAVPIGKRVALNVVQVGTALGLHLDQWLERSLFDPNDPPARSPTGGMAKDVIDDRGRPQELGTA